MPFRKLACVLLLICLPSLPSHHRTRQRSGQSGEFDFYLFVLSWSPEFCFSHRNAAECSKHTGFVVHGLWPQNNDGSYPQDCRTDQPAPTHPDTMSDIMPPEIIQHEWQRHGTCSGLSGDAYFALIRKLYGSLKIPARLTAPSSSFTTSSGELKQTFMQANPTLRNEDIAIQLRGNYLSAVEFCESKSSTTPAPIACSVVSDTRKGTFVIPPVK